MDARPKRPEVGKQVTVMRCRILFQAAAAGKAHTIRIAQQADGKSVDQHLGDIDQHQ